MSETLPDSTTSVDALKNIVATFVADRQWEQFHTPKNLATSICIEAAELAEHFQWLTAEQSIEAVRGISNDHLIAQELADVLSYVLAFANVAGIDVATALQQKMQKNAFKYPIPNLAESHLETPADESNYPSMDGG